MNRACSGTIARLGFGRTGRPTPAAWGPGAAEETVRAPSESLPVASTVATAGPAAVAVADAAVAVADEAVAASVAALAEAAAVAPALDSTGVAGE